MRHPNCRQCAILIVARHWPLSDFSGGRYHLRVHGPNGFFRDLRGGADDPLVAVTVNTDVDPDGRANGNLQLALRVAATSPDLRLQVITNGYAQPPLTRTLGAGTATTHSIPLAVSHGWYDFNLVIDGAPGFVRRYAGRIETGLPSRTDPVMGRAK